MLWPHSSPTSVSWSTVRPSPRQNMMASTGVPTNSSTPCSYSSFCIGGSYM